MPEVSSNLTPSVGQIGAAAAAAALALSTETQKEQNNQSTVFLPRGRQTVLNKTRIENLGLRTAVPGQEELAGYSEAMWQNRLGLCNSGFIWATIVVVVLLLGASGVSRDLPSSCYCLASCSTTRRTRRRTRRRWELLGSRARRRRCRRRGRGQGTRKRESSRLKLLPVMILTQKRLRLKTTAAKLNEMTAASRGMNEEERLLSTNI